MAANDGFTFPAPPAPRAPAPQAVPPMTTPKPRPKPPEAPATKDVFREVVETVVFVIVLVFLLKIFVAEAFVIPTGSMAETLLGYHKFVTCPQCQHEFPVNCSQEVDPQDRRDPVLVNECVCPNCRFKIVWRDAARNGKTVLEPPAWGSGDRVLVSKFPYDKGHLVRLGRPDRFNVVVFKYPEFPQRAFVPMNYIKRLIGLPDETIAIYNGDLYVCPVVPYPAANHPLPERPEDLWQKNPTDYTYQDDEAAVAAFNQGRFRALRRSPDIMMVMRRLVYDNDHLAADLLAHQAPPRWRPTGPAGWTPADPAAPRAFRHAGAGGDVAWLRYQHVVIDRSNLDPLTGPVDAPRPQRIKNFMGYNAGEPSHTQVETNWVGDLMLECEARVESADGELVLELSEGAERFQARFNLAGGDCTLVRVKYGADGKPAGEETLGRREKVLPGPGTYKLRFANFDDRLTLWVDNTLPFGDGVAYEPNYLDNSRMPATAQEDHPNNLEPASVGARGGAKLSVAHVRLWRDTFYTSFPESPRNQLQVRTLYVQPGHYLCLGDNSTESADSRSWGLVPERLMLGRALVVYWPLTRAGVIR
jgi:signal peptidase I